MGKIFLTILFILTGVLFVFSQEKILEENEFTEIINKTETNLKGITYRLTKTKVSFIDRDLKPEIIEISLKEIVPPNKWRTVEEYKSSEKNTKTERLWDGQNLYERKDDGAWVKYAGGSSAGGSFTSGKITKTYKFIEKTNINGQMVNVYSMQMDRIANKFTQTSMYQVHYIEKTKFWITVDGRILKKVIESEIEGSKQLLTDTWIYEYDSTLTIEAPITRG